MKLVLDTHTFGWWVNAPELLSSRAADAIALAGPKSVYVSAVSAYKISLKHRIGKLPDGEDGIRAGQLPMLHRGPFDRSLIAQAMLTEAWLVSNERLFGRYGVRRLW